MTAEEYINTILRTEGEFFKKGILLYGSKADQFIDKLFRKYEDNNNNSAPILLLETPQNCSAKDLCNAILTELGLEELIKKKQTLYEKQENVLCYFRIMEVRFLALKSFDVAVPERKTRSFNLLLSTLKLFLNSGTGIILAGTERTAKVIKANSQLQRRFVFFQKDLNK
ncbi:TniB family NTP-binding protein [Desulfurobacterium sp.]